MPHYNPALSDIEAVSIHAPRFRGAMLLDQHLVDLIF